MKLEFPKVTNTIRLSEYAPEFGDAQIQVWMNVPRDVITQLRAFRDMQTQNADVFAWLNRVWGEVWPVEEIETLWIHCSENDPAFWDWLIEQTVILLMDYRTGVKKA